MFCILKENSRINNVFVHMEPQPKEVKDVFKN